MTGLYSFGGAAVFGSTAALFLISLATTRWLWHELTPTDHPIPSPTLSPRANPASCASGYTPRQHAASALSCIHNHGSPYGSATIRPAPPAVGG